MLRKNVVAASLCLWIASGSVWAQCPEGSSSSGDYCYTESGGSVTITKYVGAGGAVVIPGTIEAMPVVHIGDDAFRNDSSVISVTIPDGVTSIGSSAFRFCSSLTSVTIPAGLTSIGDSAFNSCTALTGVSIPASVTSIGAYAFWACNSLASIDVDPANGHYSSDGGVLYNKTQTLLIKYPAAKPGAAFSIPGTVTSIEEGAFHRNTTLSSVTIPDGVTSIGRSAFQDCSSLASVNIPAGITRIAGYLFSGCSSLDGVTIPESVTNIAFAAFRDCSSLTSVIIPVGVTSIPGYTFQNCSSLVSVNIPADVTSIGMCSFQNCSSLTEVTMPASVASIDGQAFQNCALLASLFFVGDAPASLGGNIFTTTPATIYRRAAASGWPAVGDSWNGRPTALWEPGWDFDHIHLGGGWRRLSWFGDYVPTSGGWFWHNRHSYFFPTSTSIPERIYLYTMDMGWLFTRSDRYPYFYRFSDQCWLWYMPDSQHPRWFNNLTQGVWEER